MLLNDPIQYGTTFPYGDISIPSPFVAPFVQQYAAPWQNLTRCLPQNVGVTPYQQFQAMQHNPMLQQVPQLLPWMQHAAFTPFPHSVVPPIAQPFGQPIAQPFGQPIPQPFPQPFGQPIPQPFPQPVSLNPSIFNWQRPYGC